VLNNTERNACLFFFSIRSRTCLEQKASYPICPILFNFSSCSLTEQTWSIQSVASLLAQFALPTLFRLLPQRAAAYRYCVGW